MRLLSLVNNRFGNNKNAKALLVYMFGNVFYKAFPLIMMPILTSLLSTSDYGIANTYISWVSIIACLNGFGLGNAIRTAYVDFKNDLDRYISSVITMAIIQSVIVSFIAILICWFFFPNIPRVLAIFCCFHAFMTCIVNAYIQKYLIMLNYKKKVALQAIPNIIIGILSVILICMFNDTKYMGRIMAYVIVYGIVGTGLLIFSLIKGKAFYNKSYWSYGARFSLPLVFSGLALVILASFDTTMLTGMISPSEAGIYSVAYSVGTAVLVISSSLESVWIPWFTQRMTEDNYQQINEGVSQYLFSGTLLISGAMLCLPEIFTIFANRKYWDGKIILPPIVLATFFIFLYSIAVNFEYYCKETKAVAINSIIAAGLNIGLNYLIIPVYGAHGAAYTTVISYVTSFILHLIYVKKINKQVFPVKYFVMAIIAAIMATTVSYLFMDLWLIRWIIAALLMVFLFLKLWIRKGRGIIG